MKKIMVNRYSWVLGAILFAAAVVRVLYLAELVNTPGYGHLFLDESYHDYWARTILFEDAQLPSGANDPLIDSTPFFRPPGYPILLAAIYQFSTHPLVVRIIQMAIGIMSCLIAFTFAKKWFNEIVALIFSGLVGLSWVFIYHEAKLLAAPLLVPLTLLLLHSLAGLIERITLRRLFVSGLLLGVYTLIRPNLLPFAAVSAIWIWWLSFRKNEPHKYRKPTRAVIVFMLGMLIAISPATVRNYMVAKDFVLVSANGGINLFFGNNEETKGVEASHSSIGPWSCFDYPRIIRDLEMKHQRCFSYSEASAHFTNLALEFIIQNPAKAIKLTAQKALLFWGPNEIAIENDVELERKNSKILRNLPMQFSMTLALALTGVTLFIARMRHAPNKPQIKLVILLMGFISVYSITIIMFFICGRYRIPIIPVLLLFASYGLHQISLIILNGNLRNAFIWCAVAAVFYTGLQSGHKNEHIKPHAWHLHRGIALVAKDQWQEGIREFEIALKTDPNEPMALCQLGRAYFHENENDKAITYLTQAIHSYPSYVRARVELGKVYGKKQQYDKAVEQFKIALDISPSSAEAHVGMGRTLLLLHQNNEAIEYLLNAVSLKPTYTDARICLGAAFINANNVDAAIQQFSEVIKQNPKHPTARELLQEAQKMKARY